MRHPCEVGEFRQATNILAQRHQQTGRGFFIGPGSQQFMQINRLTFTVRQFDTDDTAARNGRDTDGNSTHRAGDIIGKTDHTAGLGARCRFQLVQGDNRAGIDLHDLAVDTEILQHRFQHPRILLQSIVGLAGIHDRRRSLGQQIKRGKFELAIDTEIQLLLAAGFLPITGFRTFRFLRHDRFTLTTGFCVGISLCGRWFSLTRFRWANGRAIERNFALHPGLNPLRTAFRQP